MENDFVYHGEQIMDHKIPEELVEQVRNSNDIVDIISEYVQLTKKGRNYFGLCPFHGEKTPSFSVQAEKQIYHCFGCGAGGNVFSFLMEAEGFSFLESVHFLAKKANIDLSKFSSINNNQSERESKFSDMRKAHELLQKLYHHILVNTEDGALALSYLKNRGFTNDDIETFKIGYAPNSKDFAVRFLERRGFSLERMVQAGVLSNSQGEIRFLDRFRGRVIFPIINHLGDVVAFGGRGIEAVDPKYLNSPETPIYQKSNILYGFHNAKQHIRKNREIVLFEGYVDVIAAYRADVKNGVASLGTSLTEQQVGIIQRNAEKIIICYDSDRAGINATIRAAQMLSDAGCHVKVARMPDNMDPDDYIIKYGPERFKNNVIGASSSLMAFNMDYLRIGKNLNDEGERIQYIEEVLNEIAKLKRAVERDHYLRQLADEFSISLDALKQQSREFYFNQRKKDKRINQRHNKDKFIQLEKKKLLPAFQNAERMLLAYMLQNDELAEAIEERIGCNFNIDEHNAIAIMLYAFYEEGNKPNIAHFMERVNDNRLKGLISEISMLDIQSEITDETLSDLVNTVLNYPNYKKIEALEDEKKVAEENNDFLKAAQIAMEIIIFKKGLKGS